jgi:hypothetical protein
MYLLNSEVMLAPGGHADLYLLSQKELLARNVGLLA